MMVTQVSKGLNKWNDKKVIYIHDRVYISFNLREYAIKCTNTICIAICTAASSNRFNIMFMILITELESKMWPKCGHSTTLNNKGYKAHKEIGHVSELSSHPQLYFLKILG